MNLYDIPVYILSLDKRKEEWTDLNKQFRDAGFKNINHFYTGDGNILDKYDKINLPESFMYNTQWQYGNEKGKKNHWNCFISHHMMINNAKRRGWDKFLMVEDDVYLTDRFHDVWDLVKNNVPDFDLLYLGWWIGHHEDELNKQLEQDWKDNKLCGVRNCPSQVGGFHSVIINSSIYDLLLSVNCICPYDYMLNSYQAHKSIKSYYIYPKMTHIKNIHSYCEDTLIERELI